MMKNTRDETNTSQISSLNAKDFALPLFIFVVGLLGSTLAFFSLHEADRLRSQDARHQLSDRVVQAFHTRLSSAISAVKFGALMIEVNPDLNNLQFQTYANRALAKLDSVRILEWQPLVAASDLAQFEKKAGAEGKHNFRVIQPDASGDEWIGVSGREVYVPVLYAWPSTIGTIGFDMSFSPIRMESKLRSAETGEGVASGVFDLMQGGKVSSGQMAFAISQAVLDLHAPALAKGGKQAVKGYLAAVIPITPLFAQALSLANFAQYDLIAVDLTANDGKFIYSSIHPSTGKLDKTSTPQDTDITQTLEVAGRKWNLTLRPKSTFFAGYFHYFSYLVLVIGILLSAVIAFIVAATLRARRCLKTAGLLLEQRVMERTRELSSAMESLATAHTELVSMEKNSALFSMVSGIAHELNTPIGNSLTVASTLKDHVITVERQIEQGMSRRQMNDFIEQARTGSEILVRGLQKAAEMINSFKQVSIDQESEARRVFFLHEAIAEILLLLTPSLSRSHIRISCDIPHDLQMDSYPGAIYQIITNLLNNCVLHAFEPQQEGEINIRADSDQQGSLLLEVRDNGKGISEHDLKRVFDPFFTTKRGKGGSGLGLNIVHNLVNNTLAGELKLSSELGQGTTVSIRIPLCAK